MPSYNTVLNDTVLQHFLMPSYIVGAKMHAQLHCWSIVTEDCPDLVLIPTPSQPVWNGSPNHPLVALVNHLTELFPCSETASTALDVPVTIFVTCVALLKKCALCHVMTIRICARDSICIMFGEHSGVCVTFGVSCRDEFYKAH